MRTIVGRRRGRSRTHGQALVEFALVFPLLMLLLFALIDLGRVVYTHNSLAEAAREAARWGSVQARSASDIDGIEAYAVANVAGVGAGVTATAECIRPGEIVLPCAQNDTLEVEVETSMQLLTPFVAQLMNAAGLNPFQLSSTAQVLVQN
jgi:Flp pilus assembly protein TadG